MVTQDARATGPGAVTQDATAAGQELPSPQVTERAARFWPGLFMLGLGIVLILAGIVLIVLASHQSGGVAKALIWLGILVFIACSLILGGLTPVAPGRARVVQLFGKYRGTVRESGLQWVNPFTKRIAVSTRIRNQESAQAKVNDADGNPIEIAAVVVWQVQGHRQGPLRRRRLHAVRRHPDRDRRPAHRLQLPLRQPGQRQAVAARQRGRDHPAAVRRARPTGFGPRACRSSSHA